MIYSEYYMNLPKDLAGSRTKNRFRVELLWGISKLIDAYKKYDDFTVVFDFKCDIELHHNEGLDFYQVKTKKSGNHTYSTLTNSKKNSKSILGNLYTLYNPNQKIKLAIVCNKNFKIGREENLKPEICFAELSDDLIIKINNKIKEELKIDEVNLENVFYICDGINLLEPDYAIKGKLIDSFVDIKEEEPRNPNALYRLVSETAQRKACYEIDIDKYEDVLDLKGISKNEFDKMLNYHKRESINGIEETREYIKSLPTTDRRIYNKALTNILENNHSYDLLNLRSLIFKFIDDNSNSIQDENTALQLLSNSFDIKFPIEYDEAMKKIFYLLVYYIYVGGGDV